MNLLGDSSFYIRDALEYKYFKNNGIYLAFDISKLSTKGKEYPAESEMFGGEGVGPREIFRALLSMIFWRFFL